MLTPTDTHYVAGQLPAVKTEARRVPALASVCYLREHAKSAVRAAYLDFHDEACRQWDIVFNDYFPKS
jgi:hypothetical protein